MSIKHFRAAFLVASVTMTATWAGSGLQHWCLMFILASLILLQYRLSDSAEFISLANPGFGWLPKQRKIIVVLSTALIMIPSVFIIVQTWHQDFPFLSDHAHHMMAHQAAREFWLNHPLQLGLIFPGLAIAWFWNKWRQWLLISLFVLVLSGILNIVMPGYFARYPALGYFFALPIGIVLPVLDPLSNLNIGRLSNVLSIAAWLFILRPRLIKKWPDLSILPFALLLFLQKDLAYYFTSPYLEPWAIILIITAAEYALCRGQHPEVVLILGGLAALVKEQAIFCLPFFFLLFNPFRGGIRGMARNIVIFVIAVFPFILYYQKRQMFQTWRGSSIAALSEILSPGRIDIFWNRVLAQFSKPGMVLLAGTGLLCLFFLITSRKYRWPLLVFLSAGIFQVVFFYIDQISLWFTGYSRFHLLALALFSTPFLVLGHLYRKRSTVIFGVCALVCLLQGSAIIPFWENMTEPAMARNFFEHLDGPIHFPLRKIFANAEKDPAFSEIKTKEIHFPFDSVSLEPIFPVAYPDLTERYRPRIKYYVSDPDCECSSPDVSKTVLFTHYANITRHLNTGAAAEKIRRICLETMSLTCKKVQEVTYESRLNALHGFSPVKPDSDKP